MRISDWSSDVCSSYLAEGHAVDLLVALEHLALRADEHRRVPEGVRAIAFHGAHDHRGTQPPGQGSDDDGPRVVDERLVTVDPVLGPQRQVHRSEELCVGKVWVSMCKVRWTPCNKK